MADVRTSDGSATFPTLPMILGLGRIVD